MALNNRGGGPDILSTFLNANNQGAGLEIKVQDDDDVSKLSFNDNQSYICDLAMQKKNRKAMIQQEALEEAQELYEVAIGEGAEKTKELFLQIFQLVEAELLESYKEKDKLLEQRLQAAVLAEKERLLAQHNAKVNAKASQEPGPGQKQVDQIDKKIKNEEAKILKKKIKKIRNMVKDIMKDKQAMKDEKKSKQLKRLQKKHDVLVDELEKIKKDSDSATLGASSSSLELDLDAPFGGIGNDSDHEQKPKKKKKKKKTKSIDESADKPKSTKKKTRSGPRPRMPSIDESVKSSKSAKSTKSTKSSKKKISRNASGVSAKSSGTAETEKTNYTLKDFKRGRVDEDAVNMKKWEEYLTDSEFEKAFQMSRSEFKALPGLKQTVLKKNIQTW